VDKQGHVYALDGGSGKILWSFATGGSVASGPSLVNSTLFWGSGYSEFATSGTTGNNKVFAFSVGGGGN
jgi:polyvinyl alcohol dehydrogenase (cytochrome)